MKSLISVFQCGDLEDRNVHERILIVNKLLIQRLKRHGLAFKVDFKKAFDSVSCAFLDRLIIEFGFGCRLRSSLRIGWKTTKFYLLPKEAPCGFFKSTRELWQGNPLSPMIFSLVAKLLSVCLFDIIADDPVVFKKSKEDMVWNLKYIL